MWLWQLSNVGYTISGVYNFFIVQKPQHFTQVYDFIWHKDVPLKVSLFVWHLFRNRLPTKDNLFRQGVIPYDAQLCVTCCGNIKLANHLFLGCNVFNSVWHLLQNWLGISSVDPFGISDHFFQFSYSTSVSKARRSMMNFV